MVAYPQFVEGQTLSAADLNLTVDLPQNRVDRHERMLHSWGIAQGLNLIDTTLKNGSTDVAQVTLKAGMAVDPYGRQIVVTTDATLSVSDFRNQVVISPTSGNSPPPLYPVFVSYQESPAPTQGLAGGRCGSSQGSTWQEGYVVSFGSPGTEVGATEPDPTVDTDRSSLGPFPILVGYVLWDYSLKRFSSSKSTGPVPLRYVGVRADEVAAQSGTLTLRNNSHAASGETALQLQTVDGKSFLKYGTYDGNSGAVNPVFQVDSQGNIVAKGTISSTLTKGTLLVASGIITHGLRIPLPPGVSEDQVSSGEAVVQTHLSVRYDLASPPPPPSPLANSISKWLPAQRELFVDDARRVHCIIEWINIYLQVPPPPSDNIKSDSTESQLRLGACEYIILVSTPSA